MRSIGGASKLSGVAIETIRYYEREGIVPPTHRSASGRRLYGPDQIARLRFIRRSRDLGFSLNAIKSLLTLPLDDQATCSEARAIGERHLETVKAKIADLQEHQRSLVRLVGQCRSDNRGCGLLGELFAE